MKDLAPGVWQLRQPIPNAINVYLLEDVLVDAATRHAGRRILRELRGREVNAHALTHAHPDHQGASAFVCERLELPYWVPERDADAAENPRLIGECQPDHWLTHLFYRTMTGPGGPWTGCCARATRSPASA